MHVHACLHVASKINLQGDANLKVTNPVKATPILCGRINTARVSALHAGLLA
jgi:hypothetical protein